MLKYLLFTSLLLSILGQTVPNTALHDTQEISLTTTDGIQLSASYLLPDAIHSSLPAIILIHQGGSSREEWMTLPLWNKLHQAGYALLAIDLRLHGKSAKDAGDLRDLFNNPKRSPLDLQAAIEFLQADKRIDATRIGILGASIGGNLACVAAASRKYPVKSVVAMSSKTSAAQNLSGDKEPIKLANAFHIASESEQDGKRAIWAKELYDRTSGERQVRIAPGDQHGSYIIRKNPALEAEIISWFEKTL